MILALLLHLIYKADETHHLKQRWHSFCERHLIADDPNERQWPKGPWDKPDEDENERDEK